MFLQPVIFRPSVVLLDEPELGLHPLAIVLFASLVKAEAANDTQVILATQSPRLLDEFAPEDVLVADQANGGTEFRRLDPERLAVWLEDDNCGVVGEKRTRW